MTTPPPSAHRGPDALGALARALRAAAPFIVLALFAAAASVLYRAVRGYAWDHLGEDLLALGPGAVAASLAATAASYLAMTYYDALALRYVEHRLPWRRFAAASFVATAFGNNLGASAVVGATLRARVYSAWRVPGFAITRIIGFNLVTLSLGVLVLTGAGLLAGPEVTASVLHLPVAAVLPLGVVLVALPVGYVAWARDGGAAIGWRDWRIDRPSRRLAVAQVLLSTGEWLAMAAALYSLVPAPARPPFWTFAVAFAVATAAGLVSNVPGGLGVFESTLLVLLGPAAGPADMAVALVAYRLLYFLLPLVLAAVVLAGLESLRAANASANASAGSAADPASSGTARHPGDRPAADGLAVLTPPVLALGVAGAGVLLLVSGDLPGDTRAPNLSAFTMSLAGAGLLLLARGLARRLHGAWVSAACLLLAVAAVSAGHREALVSVAAAGLLTLLLLSRSAFYRTTSLLADPRGWAWPVLVSALATVVVWWHDVMGSPAAERTWWAVSLHGDAPSGVRIAAALGSVTALAGGGALLVPRAPGSRVATPEDLARAEAIVARHGRCTSHLAFTGDKRLLFSNRGAAFVMYQVEGRSWVAMGDPVGDPADFRDLLWNFAEAADRHGGRPVFYGIRGDLADLYRECGLTLVKLGEEAVVPLAGFTLEGKSRQGMRWRRNQNLKAGCRVEIIPPGQAGALLPDLQRVSDAWLGERSTSEKRFSLGAFDEDYVCRFPVAVVRQHDDVVAFATLAVSGDGQEVMVDLMRRLPDGPKHVMNFLFVECMLWAREQGIAAFSLGMAPLSGLRTDATAPFWDRIGHLLWKYGEQFYNFQGLRHFKEQFDPEWQTRYVAAPGGTALPTSMLNVASLIGGGVRGVLTR